MMLKKTAIAMTFFLCISTSWTARANPTDIIQEPGMNVYEYGYSTDADGDWLVVGAPRYENTSINRTTGAVFIYRNINGSWNHVQTLVSVGEGDRFGHDVAISGSRLAVGTPGSDGIGRILVYKLVSGTWVPESKSILSAAGSQVGMQFGYSVDMDGDMLIGGAPYADFDGWTNPGTATLFEFSNGEWRYRGWLKQASPGHYDRFGHDVAIAKDHPSVDTIVAVGAPGADRQGTNSGDVYLFSYGTSLRFETSVLDAEWNHHVGAFDQLGYSVDISREVLAIGAPYSDFSQSNDGGVYIYDTSSPNSPDRRTLFTAYDDIEGPMAQAGAQFGRTVAVDATVRTADMSDSGGIDQYLLAIGVPYYDRGGVVNTGAAFVYEVWPLNTLLTRAYTSSIGRGIVGAREGWSVAVTPEYVYATGRNPSNAYEYRTGFYD